MCVIFSELRTLWSEVSKSGLQWDLWDCDDCTSCVLDWSGIGPGISIGSVDVGTREHDMAFGCSSGSIFPGRFVHQLRPDCCGIVNCNGIGWIAMIVVCVCWLCCCVDVIS